MARLLGCVLVVLVASASAAASAGWARCAALAAEASGVEAPAVTHVLRAPKVNKRPPKPGRIQLTYGMVVRNQGYAPANRPRCRRTPKGLELAARRGDAAKQLASLLASGRCAATARKWRSRTRLPAMRVGEPNVAAGGALEFLVEAEGAAGLALEATVETPHALVGCDVSDALDGTYRFRCAPAGEAGLAGARANLTVAVQYVANGGFYNDFRLPLGRKLVQDCPVVLPDGDGAKVARPPTKARACGRTAVERGGAQWVRAEPSSRWKLAYPGCAVNAFSKRDVGRCLTKRNVTMVGPSHMRFFYDGVLEILGVRQQYDLDVKHDGHEHSERLRYVDTTFSTTNVNPKKHKGPLDRMVLKALPESLRADEVLVVQTGSWDLKFGGLDHALNGLVPVMQRLKELAEGPGTVVFVTTPALTYTFFGMVGYRSNPGVRVLAEAAAAALGPTAVRVVDVEQVQRARLWERDECNGHMMCVVSNDAPMVGEVGMAALDALLTVACEE